MLNILHIILKCYLTSCYEQFVLCILMEDILFQFHTFIFLYFFVMFCEQHNKFTSVKMYPQMHVVVFNQCETCVVSCWSASKHLAWTNIFGINLPLLKKKIQQMYPPIRNDAFWRLSNRISVCVTNQPHTEAHRNLSVPWHDICSWVGCMNHNYFLY